jgi:phage shock protein C
VDRQQLVRSRVNRRIAGVCGGIGEYFNLDPTLIRIAFVVATFMGFAGPLIYIVLWIVLPEAAKGAEPVPAQSIFGGSSPALRIAEDRFARGEISAQELQQIREDLGRGV